jgi:hypothetical protein
VCFKVRSVPPEEFDSDMTALLCGFVFIVPPRRAVGCQFKGQGLNGHAGTYVTKAVSTPFLLSSGFFRTCL